MHHDYPTAEFLRFRSAIAAGRACRRMPLHRFALDGTIEAHQFLFSRSEAVKIAPENRTSGLPFHSNRRRGRQV